MDKRMSQSTAWSKNGRTYRSIRYWNNGGWTASIIQMRDDSGKWVDVE